MSFIFRAHHPTAYFRFALLLLFLIALNLIVIALIFPDLKNANDVIGRSIILIVPWIFLLLLPSIVLGILVYRSFVKTFRFTIDDSRFTIELLKKQSRVVWKKDFSWQEIKSVQIIDFEDNHYCNIRFVDKKNDLVLHRESGDFELFYSAIQKFLPEIVLLNS